MRKMLATSLALLAAFALGAAPVDPAATNASIDRLIAPHVENVETSFSVVRADLPNASDAGPASMYMVFSYQVKLGRVQQFEDATT